MCAQSFFAKMARPRLGFDRRDFRSHLQADRRLWLEIRVKFVRVNALKVR